jgi:hypothetical protein
MENKHFKNYRSKAIAKLVSLTFFLLLYQFLLADEVDFSAS